MARYIPTGKGAGGACSDYCKCAYIYIYYLKSDKLIMNRIKPGRFHFSSANLKEIDCQNRPNGYILL